MAIFYTDVAAAQILGNNFPGAPGQAQIGSPPNQQTNALFEAPGIITATLTLAGTEAVGDTINICKLEEGYLVDPHGFVSSGITAPATTLTIAIGDNDQGLLTARPYVNAAGAQATVGQMSSIQAPVWVSGTSYVPGNVVLDPTASSGAYQQFDAFLCVSNTSGATAPNAAATTVWMPCRQRYSASINVAGASSNVAFAAGTQLYGGPASILPFSITPGAVPTGYPAAQIANQPYVTQGDCWLQARVLTSGTPVANTVLVFRIPVIASN